jgi:hypothetical protein
MDGECKCRSIYTPTYIHTYIYCMDGECNWKAQEGPR